MAIIGGSGKTLISWQKGWYLNIQHLSVSPDIQLQFVI